MKNLKYHDTGLLNLRESNEINGREVLKQMEDGLYLPEPFEHKALIDLKDCIYVLQKRIEELEQRTVKRDD